MTEEQFWSGLGDYQERILNIITNLSSKTYVGIVNLKNKQTWWSQRVVDFFGLEKGVFDYAMEKSTVKVHPDDRDKYLKGFSDRMQGKHLNERFEYRLMTGKYTCSLFSAYGQIVQDEQGEPALLVLVAENHGISDEIDSDMHDNLELISIIHRDAIEKREGFFLCYQPIADTKDGEIRGMEALLRWKKEPYGVVPPGVFIEWLEEDPCIFDLGNWIISQALRDLKEISKEKPDFFVNVNISAGQIERKEFRETVLWLLKKSGLKPEQLCMELTERCRELDVNFLKQEIDFFKSKGIKVAMDDFGTGNASLALALDLPVDELKIDMSFVRGIQEKPVKQAMVQSIVSFAQNTEKETCIEGVEDKVLLDYLKKYHATWHQGYYYSRPIPFDEFKKLLHDLEKNNSVKEEIV